MKKKGVQIFLAILIGILGFFIIRAQVSQTSMDNWPAGLPGLMRLLPFFFVSIVIFKIAATLGKDTKEEIEEGIDWTRYGERLKLAYSAKFGGSNPGFDQEVDYRIKIMVNTDRGWSRQLAKDWINRMSKFVDIKWLKMENSNKER